MKYKMPSRQTPLALIVDDVHSIRLSMRAAMIKAGFDVLEAENGQVALEIFEANQPDLVLLDVVMPEMDGFEACREIRRLPGGDNTQILMVTGLDDVESTQKAFDAGANDFISKPINWIMLGYKGQYMLRAGRAFQALIRSKRRLRKTQEIAKIGNWEINLDSNDFLCSPEATQLLGLKLSAEEVSFNDFLSPLSGRVRENVRGKIYKAVNDRSSCSLNYRINLDDGGHRHIHNYGEIIFNENGKPEIMLGTVQDVTQLREAEEEVKYLAFYDSLTGLANRFLFKDRLTASIINSQKKNACLSLLFIDIEQFQRINDTFGHHVGDLLLKNVSESLQQGLKTSKTIARLTGNVSRILLGRLGGDEFTIMLPDIKKPENAAIVARRLMNYIPATYNLNGNEVLVSSNIGISVFPEDGVDPETLLKNAYTAMHYAKKMGRNKCQFYTESMNIETAEKLSLERDLRKALDDGEFVLYYQPQVELSSRKIVGAEALIRWVHPQRGMIYPDKFIPLAEESDMILDINKWVIQTACKQNKEWQNAGLPAIRMAVNVSAHQFAQQNILQTVKNALLSTGLDVQHFEVEITENVLMQEGDESIAVLQDLKDLSLRISLDDFGTGYSSLSYLMSFPVDTIKIDRSFVMGCTSQKKNLIIIKAIMAMGHSLGMKIIGEGIETEEEFEILRQYGCDEAQGYFFKPPVPHDEFALLLQKGKL